MNRFIRHLNCIACGCPFPAEVYEVRAGIGDSFADLVTSETCDGCLNPYEGVV